MGTPRVTDYMVFAAHDYIEWPCKNDYPQRACGRFFARSYAWSVLQIKPSRTISVGGPPWR